MFINYDTTLAQHTNLNHEKVEWYEENGIQYKSGSDETLNQQMISRLNIEQNTSKAYIDWCSDGEFGTIEFNGEAKVVETQNPDNTFSACIICFIDGQASHAGACRPISN